MPPGVQERLGIVVHHEHLQRVFGTDAQVPRNARRRRDTGPRFVGGRDREREASTRPLARALGPDTAPVRLHQALADGQSQPASHSPPAVSARAAGELPEQVRQTLGRYAGALVDDGDGHVNALLLRGHPDGRGPGRVARRVGEQIAQHLDDALAVRQHQWQVRQVDDDGVRAPSAHVQVPRLIHDGREIRGLERDRQPARLDVRRVQQIADQLAHVVRLLVDDAEELDHFGRAQRRRRPQQRARRTLDRGERRLELMAHHAQELGPEHLDLLQRRQVLQRDDH